MPLSSEPALQRAIQLITDAQASLQDAENIFYRELPGILGNETYTHPSK